MPPPPAVRTAALLLWALVGLMVVRTVLTFVLLDDITNAYAEDVGGAPAYVPVALFTLLVFGGLLSLCAHFVPRAAAWARIVATMFASLAALAGLQVLVAPTTALFTLVGLLNAGVAVTAVVLLFSPASNDFFSAAKRARRRSPSKGQPSA